MILKSHRPTHAEQILRSVLLSLCDSNTLIGLALVGVSLRVKLVSARGKFNADNVVRDKLDESNQPATKADGLISCQTDRLFRS